MIRHRQTDHHRVKRTPARIGFKLRSDAFDSARGAGSGVIGLAADSRRIAPKQRRWSSHCHPRTMKDFDEDWADLLCARPLRLWRAKVIRGEGAHIDGAGFYAGAARRRSERAERAFASTQAVNQGVSCSIPETAFEFSRIFRGSGSPLLLHAFSDLFRFGLLEDYLNNGFAHGWPDRCSRPSAPVFDRGPSV